MCTINKDYPEAAWVSLILRIAMASLFAVASISKFIGGIGATVSHFQEMFKATWLPLVLVTPYAYAIAFAEALIVIWLLSGISLRAGWIFTAGVLISLGFGLSVAKQSSADVFMFLLTACMGLYVSQYDQCVIGGKK